MKKRKMDTPTQHDGAGAADDAVPAEQAPQAVVDAHMAAAEDEPGDAGSDGGGGGGDGAASSSPLAGSATVPCTAEEVAAFAAQLPATLTMLQRMNGDLVTCKLPHFHALRKEVLRLAAALQNVRSEGRTTRVTNTGGAAQCAQ